MNSTQRQNQRIVDMRIAFINSIPVFAQWPKHRALKLTMDKVFKQKDQVVIGEGSHNDHVFIIVKGEFRCMKRLKVEKPKNDLKERQMLTGLTTTPSVRSVCTSRVETLTSK